MDDLKMRWMGFQNLFELDYESAFKFGRVEIEQLYRSHGLRERIQ